MKAVKQLLRPERQRQIPAQFSWVDQALVQQHFIDRCESRSAALYLFLVTVSDAQGLSYYGAATLARRLHLSDEQFGAARQQLIDLDLIAYRSPLYQVLALPGTVAAPRPAPRAPAITGTNTRTGATTAGQPVSLATLLQLAQQRRG
ncbi:MAG TPA: hypothetical protein VIW70_04635 [Rubrivivax sp.]